MKFKTVLLLSIIPLLQIGFGLWGTVMLRHYPQAQEAKYLRDYISAVETKKDKPSDQEADMLAVLKNALKSLDDYYKFYPPLRTMQNSSFELEWGFGSVELFLIGSAYFIEKKRVANLMK